MPHSEAAVVAEGLRVSYRRRFRSHVVLDELDLEVSSGAVAAIVGRNGEGKTTLFRALVGLHPIDRGRVRIGGCAPGAARDGRHIGFMPELVTYPPSWTVADVLGFGVDLAVPPEGHREAFATAVARGRLDDQILAKRANRCSKGYRQRLSLAFALIGEPAVVFLDEPFSGLDPPSRVAMRSEIESMAARSATVVLTSHDLAEVGRLASDIFVLDGGRLRASPLAHGAADSAEALEAMVTTESP
ncbi:ABC transporter ATP-binding protein [Candidatus Palauibacter sp.]|uniref:ABC transporter ATP-binding protein n=1 Tax=Candidatus Palauibacter sp. TaxID=3101350 RepID=UPI003C6FE0C0